jgi:hypothetical protein
MSSTTSSVPGVRRVTMGSAGIQGLLWGAAAEDWAELVEPQSAGLHETVLPTLELAS